MEFKRSFNSKNLLEEIQKQTEGRKIHYNIPQMYMHLINANVMVGLMGRAMGKTRGIQSKWSEDKIKRMPRSRGNAVGSSMVQLLDNLLPDIIAGWEALGYKENKHFFVRKKPPVKSKFEKPYLPLLSYDHAISWYNGVVINLISFDKNATLNNGKSSDWSMIDEARTQNKKKLDERLLLTMRGQLEHFGHLDCHLSQLYTSDLPQTSSEMWLLDFEKNMDEKVMEWIYLLQVELIKKEFDFKTCDVRHKHWYAKQIDELKTELSKLRKNATFVMYASTLENIHVLGLDVIKNFKNTLDPLTYESSVLNRMIIHIDNCFYPAIDEDDLYWDYNYSYIEGKGKDRVKDCREDSDLDANEPLYMHMDYGQHFNCMVVGQPVGNIFYMLNSFYGEGAKGETTESVVQKFCDYYLHHKCKKVIYYCDQTSKQGSGVTLTTYREVVITTLKKNSWIVDEQYVGQTPEQSERYKFISDIIRKKDDRLFVIKWNKDRTENPRIAMQQTPVKKKGDDIAKEKKSEDPRKNPNQVHATHFTDAVDGLLIYIHTHLKSFKRNRRLIAV